MKVKGFEKEFDDFVVMLRIIPGIMKSDGTSTYNFKYHFLFNEGFGAFVDEAKSLDEYYAVIDDLNQIDYVDLANSAKELWIYDLVEEDILKKIRENIYYIISGADDEISTIKLYMNYIKDEKVKKRCEKIVKFFEELENES